MYIAIQVRKPNGSGIEWAECSLIIGTGCWVQVFNLILDSSVGLPAGIQSAGHSVPFQRPWFESCIQERKTTCLLSIRKSLACAKASKLRTTKMYTTTSRCESQPAMRVEWAECSLIMGRAIEFKFLVWSSIAQSVCQRFEIRFQRRWFRILHLAEEDNLSPFDSKTPCLCQSIEMNNNNHVRTYVQQPCTYVRTTTMYICTYNNHVRMYVRTFVCTSECMCVCMCVCMSPCIVPVSNNNLMGSTVPASSISFDNFYPISRVL